MTDVLDTFSVRLDVTIRLCREEDLPAMEWLGLFTPHRNLIRATFERHQRGEAIMLVAEANHETSGQLWIDLPTPPTDRTAVIWAVRIVPCLQRLGIGTRLLAAAETLLEERGTLQAELHVEADNPNARRLYERLGYTPVGTRYAAHPPGAPGPDHPAGSTTTQWVRRKLFAPRLSAHSDPGREPCD